MVQFDANSCHDTVDLVYSLRKGPASSRDQRFMWSSSSKTEGTGCTKQKKTNCSVGKESSVQTCFSVQQIRWFDFRSYLW